MSLALDSMMWPIAIYQDRCSGVYCGGKWIAVANADQHRRSVGALGAYGDDITAMAWGANIPKWAAVGDTPAEALANLYRRFAEKD